MKLKNALHLAGDCGLTTVGEAIYNVKVRCFDLFHLKDIKKEIHELEKEFEVSWLHEYDLVSDAIKRM